MTSNAFVNPRADARYRRIAIAAMWLAALGVVATFRDYGITWDEHVQHIYGERLLAFYGSLFSDRSAFHFDNLYLYGGLFDILAALVAMLLPGDLYELRHLVGGLFGVFGLWGTWKLTGALAGDRAGAIAVVLLATSPLMIGHSFTNPKDAPLAWLTIWACYFVCRAISEAPTVKPGTILGLGVAIGAVLGQRIIGGHLVLWALLVVAVWPFVNRANADRASALLKAGALAVPIAVLVMAFFWPWSVQDTGNSIAALAEFSRFPFETEFPWNGVIIKSTDVPTLYVPRLLLVQLSDAAILAIVLALVGFATTTGKDFIRERAPALAFLALCAMGPLIVAMITKPTLYNGLRHFLFVIPLITVLSAIGADRLILRMEAGARRPPATGVVLALASLAMFAAIETVRLHPYAYVAFNRLSGGIGAAKGRDELDYWGASLTELARDVRAYAANDDALAKSSAIKTFVCGRQESTAHTLGDRFEIVNDLAAADIYLGIDERVCAETFNTSGAVIGEVRRDGALLGKAVRLK